MYAQSLVEYTYTEISFKIQCIKNPESFWEKKKNLSLVSLLI